MSQNGPHVDALSTRNLRSPLLNEYFGSAAQKDDVASVAEEIKRRYLTKLAPHNQTGRLASTAQVTSHRSKVHADNRWEAEFSVGGGRADYADDLERKYGLLASVLQEMGFYQGDAGGGARSNPAQKAPRREADEQVTLYHRARTGEDAQSIAEKGFSRGSRGDWVYLSTELNSHHSPFGDHVVVTRARKGDVFRDNEDEGYSVRVRRQSLSVESTMFHVGEVPDEFPTSTPSWIQNDGIMRPTADD